MPPLELEQMLKKHSLIEIRKRNFFWYPFLWVCFIALLNGQVRHKDRKALYLEIFKISLSENSISERFSVISPAFFKELIKRIQPHLNRISSPFKRMKAKEMIYRIVAEDASVFHLDNRLLDIFKAIPGCDSAGLKLYVRVNVVGDIDLRAKIKNARSSDVKHKSTKTKNNKTEKTIETRDRGWYSWKVFAEWIDAGKHFISRVKSTFNPQIVKVLQGDNKWKKKRFKEIDLEGHDEVDMEVKPYRAGTGVYRRKDNSVFTIRLKGKKAKDGVWYWYVYHLPNADNLTFDDVHAIYRARWIIEEIFRELKQAFGGDHLKLRKPVSVVNHIYMMLIAYLICKGYLQKIALVHRKSLRGFYLDTCMKGSLRVILIGIIFYLVDNTGVTNKKLYEISKAYCESAYSAKRARSYRISRLGKALRKMINYDKAVS